MTLSKQRRLNLTKYRKGLAKDTRDRRFMLWLRKVRGQSFRTFAMT